MPLTETLEGTDQEFYPNVSTTHHSAHNAGFNSDPERSFIFDAQRENLPARHDENREAFFTVVEIMQPGISQSSRVTIGPLKKDQPFCHDVYLHFSSSLEIFSAWTTLAQLAL